MPMLAFESNIPQQSHLSSTISQSLIQPCKDSPRHLLPSRRLTMITSSSVEQKERALVPQSILDLLRLAYENVLELGAADEHGYVDLVNN